MSQGIKLSIDIERLKDLALQGKTIQEISEAMGQNFNSVAYVIRKMRKSGELPSKSELKKQKQKEKSVPERKRIDTGKVMALYRAGWTAYKIAREMYTTEDHIRTVISEYASDSDALQAIPGDLLKDGKLSFSMKKAQKTAIEG